MSTSPTTSISKTLLLIFYGGMLWCYFVLPVEIVAISAPPFAAILPTPGKTTVHSIHDLLAGTIPTNGEPCDSTETHPNAIVLSPQDPWQALLSDDDAAAHTFLLRGGIYQAEDKLWLPAGTEASPTVIKPYNCEQVILRTSLRPSSHTVIAGMQIEAVGIDDTKWVVRFDGKDRGALTSIVLRYNTILGGTLDAIRINDDVQDVLIQGNVIDGGASGHDIFVTGEPFGPQPDRITITQNRLTKHYFESASEDMIQVRDVKTVKITSNICTAGLNMEQCIDIKSASMPLWISHNIFDGDQLHTLGNGEDKAGGCMVIHENDGHNEQHVITNNRFIFCKGTIIRFATGTRSESSSALVHYNLFVQRDGDESSLPIEVATDVEFSNNTMVYGRFKLGNSSHSRLPQNLLIQNNIFYQTAIEDHTLAEQSPYICTHNLLYRTGDDGFSASPCTDTITADPQFVDRSLNNFFLLPASPALGTGIGGADMGAFPLYSPATLFAYHLYLPLISQPIVTP